MEGANKAVEAIVLDQPKRQKRGRYHDYDEETRAKISKYSALHGPTKAAEHFSKSLGVKLPRTTVQSMAASYRQKLALVKDPAAITALPHLQRGRPKLLNTDIDDHVQSYVRAVRDTGGVINRKIVISAALGITRSLKPSLLPENGGSLELGKPWAESILRRMGFVKRKGTKAARKLPDNFADLKDDFLKRVADTVKEHNIPPSLVVNIDETVLPIIPVSYWTLEESGAKQVSITGLDDKRQLTAFVGCTMDGEVLPHSCCMRDPLTGAIHVM